MHTRLAGTFAHPAVPFVAAALAVVLSWPAVGTGWRLDDLHHRVALTSSPVRVRGYELDPGLTGLFVFFGGDRAHNERLRRAGVIPWWAELDLKIAFCRPLAAATHLADYRLWPDSPRVMHVHSLAWLFAGVLATGLLYRRLLPPAVAGLAVLLFAIDDAHALAATWIAQRNHLLVLIFGVLAIVLHDAWRRRGSTAAAVFAAVFLAMALAAGESGIGVVAYLAAYAVTLDSASPRARLLSLAPAFTVCAAWRALTALGGFGLAYSDSYLDPAHDPLRFLVAALQRAPLLLLGQWSIVRPEIALFVPSLMPVGVALGVVVVAILAWAMWPLLRREALARFLALGMLLAVIPLCATFAQTRTLLLAGIGGMGLLALFLSRLPELLRDTPRPARWGRLAVAVALVITHVVVAPIALWRTTSLSEYRWAKLRLPETQDLAGKTIVVVNGPANLLAAQFPLERDAAGLSVPAAVHALFPSITALTVQRPSGEELRFSADKGWLATPLDLFMRSLVRPFARGDRVDLGDIRVTVNDVTADGRPLTVTARFARALEDPALLWVAFTDGRYHVWQPPPVGGRVDFPLPRPQ